MNKSRILYAAITLIVVAAGSLVFRARPTSRDFQPVTSSPQTRSREQSREPNAGPTQPWPTRETRTAPVAPINDPELARGKGHPTSDQISRAEYSRISRSSYERTYGKAIKGLGLSIDDQVKLMDMLIERSEVHEDVGELLGKNPRVSEDEYRAAMAEAYALVDKDIEATFGAEKYRQINDMIKTTSYVTNLSEVYDPPLTAAGRPLAADQILTVAKLMSECYGKAGSPSTAPSLSNVDSTSGLTPVDEVFLGRLTSILAKEQLRLFQEVLAKKNANYLAVLRWQQEYSATQKGSP